MPSESIAHGDDRLITEEMDILVSLTKPGILKAIATGLSVELVKKVDDSGEMKVYVHFSIMA